MKKEDVFFKRIGIVGVGLIGASFALAMKERKCVKEIWGFSKTVCSTKKAIEFGIIDKATGELEDIAKNCDFILVATPVLSIPEILKKLSEYVDDGVIVSDGGSVKNFVRECHRYFKYKNYIGAHPVAGTEKSGPEAGFSSLFDGSVCIVTPVEDCDGKKYETVVNVWETLGMNVVSMTPEEHDIIMSEVSHMPHAVAFSLVYSVKDKYFRDKRVTSFAGGGFRDFTRIAKSDVAMWTDIFLANKENLLSSLADFETAITSLKKILKEENREKLISFIKDARDCLLGNEKK